MEDSLVYLLKNLLKQQKIKINSDELSFQILSHPTYPSLHAITGVLDHFGIENTALRIPVSNETLQYLEGSFLVQVQNHTGHHFVICKVIKDRFHITFNKEYSQDLDANEFLELWTGVLVSVEANQEESSNSSSLNISYSVIGGAILLLLSLFFIQKPSLYTSLHFILTALGCGISVLIILKELGIESKALNAFCSNEENTKKDCDKVLSSDGATLFGFLKLSDISLIYFFGLLLSWVLCTIGNHNYSLITATSYAVLPITLYSIYYQAKVVKQWCTLCLSIVSILWLQVFINYFGSFNLDFLDLIYLDYIIILFSFIAIAALWFSIAPALRQGKEYKDLKIKYFKFKRNFSMFDAMLNKSEQLDINISDKNEIILGNKTPKPELIITVITNPLCGYCKEVHKLVEQILDRHYQDVQIRIRFNVSTGNLDHDGVKITAKLIELYHTQGEETCLAAMHDSYGVLTPKVWIEKWGTHQDNSFVNTLTSQYEWCVANHKNFTPEILINGKTFPKEYDRQDIFFFIEDLVEQNQLKA